MSNEAVAVDVSTANVTDAQVDKYFESGGNVDLENIQDATPDNVETVENTENKAANDSAEVQAANETQKEEAKTQEKEKYVPYGALHEERQRRKELQSKVEQMEQRFQQVVQKITQPEKPPPSFDEDPLNALKYNQEQQEKYLLEQNKYLQEKYEYEKRESAKQQFMTEYHSQAARFYAENPAFGEAYQYLFNERKAEFLEAGWDENTANQLAIEDELAIAANAMKQKVNPAERLYKLAIRRGFKPSENKTQNNTTSTKNTAQKLENIQKGMNTSKSLNNVNGKVESNLSLEALADMDDDEFNKNWSKAMKLG